jgi:hypothetical protein
MKTIILVSIAILAAAYLIGAFAAGNLDITEWSNSLRFNCAIGAAIAISLYLIIRWSGIWRE